MRNMSLVVLAALLLQSPVAARIASITNAGFEDFPLAFGEHSRQSGTSTADVPDAEIGFVSEDSIPGWTIGSTTGDLQDTYAGTDHPGDILASREAPEGTNVAYAATEKNVDGFTTISQTLDESLTANTTYELLVDILFASSSIGGYSVQLIGGDTILVEDSEQLSLTVINSYNTSRITFSVSNDHSELGNFLTISLNAGDIGDAGGGVLFDNVRLIVTTIPEPSSLVISLGMFSAFLWHRKRLTR